MIRKMPLLLACGLVAATAVPHTLAESKHVFGIHFFDWGSNVDVMSHRTGWCVEANATHDGGPNVGGRQRPATAQGYTLIQRLDWKWEQTIPLGEADQNTFAGQCRDWARQIKKYCRHYSIGNEVEFFGVTPAIYASCFTKVRNAILAEQPEARVIIGHMNNSANQRSVIQIVGRDGYDGLTAHTASSVPTGLLDILDQENARPGVGVYITEFGWVADTNPNSMNVMRNFYLALGQSNRSRARQVYCACWYLYPSYLGKTFSLELSTIDNPAFEAATAIGTSVNSYADNPVLMNDLIADIPDVGTSVTVTWNTNVPARDQMWYAPLGTSGAGNEQISNLNSNLATSHTRVVSPLDPSSAYEVMPTSTRDDYGDAGGRRFKVKTGPWNTLSTPAGAGKMQINWTTDWPADAHVDYGTTTLLGQTTSRTSLAINHAVTLTGLTRGQYYYRVRSSEPNPDGTTRLYMRSPIRTFTVLLFFPDFDEDGDVDQTDFGFFQACYSGPGVIQNDPACLPGRLDADEDIDLNDFGVFQRCVSGPNHPADPDCAN
ncbi:MAG: hypothetical protein AMXMBFR13_20130 [Phycisphaerae bacterium]